MKTVKITNISNVIELLNMSCKLVPGAKFVINDKETTMMIRTVTGKARGSITTEFMTSDEPFEFCINSIINLSKSLKLVKDVEKINEIELTVGSSSSSTSSTFLSYNGKTNFNINLCDEVIIKNYLSVPYGPHIVFKDICSWSTTTNTFKKMLQFKGMVDDDNSAIVLAPSEQDGFVSGTLIDTGNVNSNSIGFDVGELIEGHISKRLKINVIDSMILVLMKSNDIKMTQLEFINNNGMEVNFIDVSSVIGKVEDGKCSKCSLQISLLV